MSKSICLASDAAFNVRNDVFDAWFVLFFYLFLFFFFILFFCFAVLDETGIPLKTGFIFNL